jgi:hypothetical protein
MAWARRHAGLLFCLVWYGALAASYGRVCKTVYDRREANAVLKTQIVERCRAEAGPLPPVSPQALTDLLTPRPKETPRIIAAPTREECREEMLGALRQEPSQSIWSEAFAEWVLPDLNQGSRFQPLLTPLTLIAMPLLAGLAWLSYRTSWRIAERWARTRSP